MTNNCVLASAAAAEPLGLSVEVLSDATGAIPLSNDAGAATAVQVHGTLMTLLNSNWAAVTTTDHWITSLQAGTALEGAAAAKREFSESEKTACSIEAMMNGETCEACQ